ncbi:MAG: acetate uptake transporter [Clostridiales bacterium]|nr:acetate uptake transporter [Clostridiales bacterium]
MNANERQITTADPSALGLFGLSMVTLVASSQKLGLTTGTAYIIPWAIFLGAIAQLFAAASDSKKNNVFGTTAFAGYGLFWLGVAASWMISNGMFGETMAANADVKQLGVAFIGYLIFSLVMTVASMETNKMLFTIFVLIDFLFLGLALSVIWGIEVGHTLAAYSELLISLVGFYGFAANILNSHFGKVTLPVGKPFGIFKK